VRDKLKSIQFTLDTKVKAASSLQRTLAGKRKTDLKYAYILEQLLISS